ncbi:MAG: TatD family hydrolase, partial [bacterium]
EAWPDTLAVIEKHGVGVTGVFHCFGGTVEEAQRALDLGWYVSFAGNLTYPKAQDLRDAAAIVPLDRLLLETDSPFLAPQPKRGKRNEPVHSLHTADQLAKVHGTDRKTVLEATTASSKKLFRLNS